MLAVLIDAIRGLTAARSKTHPVRSQRAWLRDRAWIQSDDKGAPFSFANICDALGIDPGYVRRCVMRPSEIQRPIRVRRYPERVKDSWVRLQRGNAERNMKPVARGRQDQPAVFQDDGVKQRVG
jgi:hypothetical protein